MFRMGLAVALGEMDGIELVGECERSDEVEALVASAQPDLVLLDIRLPDGSGLEVNRWLAAHHPDVRVIVLTMSEDHATRAHGRARRGPRLPREGRRARPGRARPPGRGRRRRRAQPRPGPRGDASWPRLARGWPPTGPSPS